MKVFISQPMCGKSNHEIYLERAKVVESLEEQGHTVIDSIVAETPEEAFNEPVYYLSQSILILSKCDAIFFMEGWDKARGCKIEHTIAKEYGIPIISD